MELLLHTCCAPCSTYSVNRLREEDWQVTGFWYNPNIHPFTEHEKRREALAGYAGQILLPMIWWEEYQMPLYLRLVAHQAAKPERCQVCYRLRLGKTAAMAKERGFDAFSTTLLISPYQDHALLQQVGQEVAVEHGVRFHYEDLRQGWAERGRLTRQYGLYRQQYCGCIYSEWERYGRGDTETRRRAD